MSFLINSLVIGVVQFVNTIVVLVNAMSLMGSQDTSLLIVSILVLIANLGMWVRRWHDLGESGWMVLLTFIPLANIVLWFYLVFKQGEVGENKYGAPQV